MKTMSERYIQFDTKDREWTILADCMEKRLQELHKKKVDVAQETYFCLQTYERKEWWEGNPMVPQILAKLIMASIAETFRILREQQEVTE